MDNKQKKKLYKWAYVLAILLTLVSIGFAIYLSVLRILDKTSVYVWVDYSLIAANGLFALIIFADTHKTRVLKNKYGLAKFLLFILFVMIVGIMTLFGAQYFEKFVLNPIYDLSIKFLVINVVALSIVFAIGLTLSKLKKNTTITIDSVAETPNYNDELLLKKKLSELNRKLEMQKVQKEIAQKEEMLDNK